MYRGEAIYWNVFGLPIGYQLYHGACASCIDQILHCTHNKFQQVTLKEPHYVDLHLHIPTFPFYLIIMDILGQYEETENSNQYDVTVVYMLTNFIFMIPIKSKTSEEVTKGYLKNMYSTFGGRNYLLSDMGGNSLETNLPVWLKKLGLIKVYSSSLTPIGD